MNQENRFPSNDLNYDKTSFMNFQKKVCFFYSLKHRIIFFIFISLIMIMKINLLLRLNDHYSHEIVRWVHSSMFLLFPIIILVLNNLKMYPQSLLLIIACLLLILHNQVDQQLSMIMKTMVYLSMYREKQNQLHRPHGKLLFQFLNHRQC